MGTAVQLDPQLMGDSLSSRPAPDGWLADARATTVDAIRNGTVAVGVFGEPSSGKTALCEALGTGIDDRSFTATITDPSIDPDAFLLQLLSDFGLSAGTPATGHAHDRHTLSAAVVKFLKSLKPLGAHALVIIDDAEQVGVDVYETVLQLAQAAGSDGNPLRLVLVGQPWLEGRLSAPPLSEFPPDGHWRRVTVGLDERGDVPEALSTLASPSLATSTPTPRTRTGALAMSPRLLALGGLLVLVAIGAWWATRGATPQSPSTPSFAPATPATAATQPPTAPAPPTPAATSPAVGPASSNATTGPTSAGVAGGAAAAQTAVPSATSAAAPASRESFRIVVASFETATRAQQTVSDLQRHQLAATVRTDPTNTWHQVVAGPYPSIDAARQAQRTIEQAGFADTQISLVRQTTNR